MLDYTMRSANENKLTPIRTAFSQDKPYLAEFRPTVDEFSIQQIKITNDHLNIGSSANKFLLPKSESGSILIVVEQNCEAKFETDSANGLESCAGLVYFIDANTDVEFVVGAGMKADTGDSVVLAYRAYCDIKAWYFFLDFIYLVLILTGGVFIRIAWTIPVKDSFMRS